jgi:hypothetical protein
MSRRIPDPVGLITGIAFTGIGLAFLVGEVELASRARWVWPIVLFSLGAGILAAVLRRPDEEAADAPAAGTGWLTDRSGPPAWPRTEAQPAPPEPSGTAAWPGVEATQARPASAPVPEERSETPAWPRGESPADAEDATAVEEQPGTTPDEPVADEEAAAVEDWPGTMPDEPVADEEAAAVEEPAAPEASSDADEGRGRQAGGPPA